jgi:hypothetical protein
MNKQDAVKRIEAIEAEARALRAIIEAPDKPAPPTRWEPRDWEQYYYQVGVGGDAMVFFPCALPITKKEYAHGNCFQTREHAEIAAKAVSVTLKVCAAAFAVDPDAGVQVCNERSWTVLKHRSVHGGKHEWVVQQYNITTSYPCYVHTFEQAEKMADILNAEGV